MDETSVKEKILKAVREALIEKDEDLYQEQESMNTAEKKEDKSILFAENFTAKGGRFLFCEKSKDLIEGVTQLFNNKALSNILCSNSDLSEVLQACNINHFSSIENNNQIDFVVMQAAALVSNSGGIVLSFDAQTEPVVMSSGAALVIFATTTQVVYDYTDVPKSIFPHYKSDIPAFLHLVEQPSTKNKLEFPCETYVFLKYVK